MQATLLLIILINIFYSIESDAGQLNLNISTGYENISSPLVRIDLESPLILVEGISQLEGQYYQFSANGLKDWDLGNGNTFNLSAYVNVKDSANASDLNLSIASLDATYRKKIDELNVGFGPSVQRIWVANSDFRDAISLQSDFTYAKEDGSFTNVYLAISKNYYVDEFEFLDSKSAMISFTHHIKDLSLLGFNALDLQLSATRDKNIKDANDLSNHSFYGRVSLDKELLGLTWSVGTSITWSYFDEPFFDGFAKRRDRYMSYDFSVEKKISDKLSFSLNLTKAKNNSNLALFESDYKDISFALSYNY